MTRATLAALFILGLSVWVVLAMMTLDFFEWLRKPGNSVRFSIWIGAFVLIIVTLFAHDGSSLAGFRTDAISIAITVIVLEELGRYRGGLEEKERLIRQMASHSNEFALEAVRQIRENDWHKDGSLCNRNLSYANLQNARLLNANLAGIDLRGAKLQESRLERANLERAILNGANLTCAHLNHARLQKAQLNTAILKDAHLVSAELQGAELIDSKLEGADLGAARLQETDLRFAGLQNTILSSANLYKANLLGAMYTRDTKWPEGFDYEAAGAILVRWSDDKQDWVLCPKGEDLIDFA